MTRFRGRTVVITGAGAGLGRELALSLAAAGSSLALSDVELDAVTATAAACRDRTPGRVSAHRVDVADRRAVLAHVDDVLAVHGGVDVLINNAGGVLTAAAQDQSFADIDRILAIDLGGVIDATQAFLPHLIASGAGHVVTISSIFGFVGAPALSAYTTAKFAVRGYSEALAMDMQVAGLPVRVTVVHPSGMRTDFGTSARTAGDLTTEGIQALFGRIAFTSPQRAARTIVRAVARDRRRVVIGPDAHLLHALERVVGSRYQPLVAAVTGVALARARRRP